MTTQTKPKVVIDPKRVAEIQEQARKMVLPGKTLELTDTGAIITETHRVFDEPETSVSDWAKQVAITLRGRAASSGRTTERCNSTWTVNVVQFR